MKNKIIDLVLQIKVMWLVIATITNSIVAIAQSESPKSNEKNIVYIDKQGIMRWRTSNAEVALFGVNYTTPFAYAYRAHNYVGVPHEKAIDEDVYHMARLGLDAFRVHVWDCEISDSVGNLIDNDHLRLLDYQLKKMKERGMKFLITPIAYWGNGYPEPGEKTPGFSAKYGKENCLFNPVAIKAQETYLYQFVNHINRYTGLAYKDDPDIIAFEICNEPHHHGTAEETTNFINRLASAIRSTGCEKPVFYNTSHSIQLADAYFSANIQGGTFQWYPSGLVSGHEQLGNYLPNVDVYTIPYADNEKFKKMAKVVYEFDGADIGRSYIYPYMAKSFREAGFQFATQFAYDPLNLAYSNTEYTTHYMNLAYAPQKALSLKIAGEVFHKVPLGRKKVSYPKDSVFDVFRVSYKTDLAEMVTDEKFIYTNYTVTMPPSVEKLKQIAGYGNSKVVSYAGCGAYFLDKLEDGIWRLEVMPDAVWVRDPFERASLKKEVAVILWNEWPMTINLANLGENYSFTGLNDGNNHNGKAEGRIIQVTPGAYLLVRNGKTSSWKGDDKWNNIRLKEFVAPPATCKKTYLLHQPLEEASDRSSVRIEAKVVSAQAPEAVELFVYSGGWRPELIKMVKKAAYSYVGEIPEKSVKTGFLRYYIVVKETGVYTTYPSVIQSRPTDWDFYGQNPYQIRVVKTSAPICIFNAASDVPFIAAPRGNNSYTTLPTETPGEVELKLTVDRLNEIDPENKNSLTRNDFSFKFFFANKIKGRLKDIDSCSKIVLYGHSLTGKPCLLQLALVMDNGSAFGGLITLQPEDGKYSLRLTELKKVKTVVLPYVYPTFLPYYFNASDEDAFNINRAESLQFSLGPGMPENEYSAEHSIAIEHVILE